MSTQITKMITKISIISMMIITKTTARTFVITLIFTHNTAK